MQKQMKRCVLGVLVAAGVVAAGLIWTKPAAQAPASAGSAPRAQAAARPDLQGIWQVMNSANVNVLAHSASSDGQAGPSVVEGGVLPYQDWAIKKRQENYENRQKLDGEYKCHIAGVPRATYLP